MRKKQKSISDYKKQQYLFASLLLLFPIVLFLVFCLYTYLYSLYISFCEMDFLGNATFVGFSNLFLNYKELFAELFTDGALVGISFLNSLKSFAITFLISNPLYFIFSYFIFKKTFGSRFFSIVSMLPQMISSLIFSLIFKQVVSSPLIEFMGFLGVKDFPNLLSSQKSAYGLVLFYQIWVSFGLSVIYYSNAMNAIDAEIIESSQLDGVKNMFQELFYILIPMIFPTFKTMLVIGLTTLFRNDYGLMNFYMYGAAPELYHMGYYYSVKIYNSSSVGYPLLSASGVILALISAPIVFGIKKVTDRIDPMEA